MTNYDSSNTHCAIVFGGKSPLAREITLLLSETINVFHVTREESALFAREVYSTRAQDRVKQVIFDLEFGDLTDFSERLSPYIKTYQRISIVFAHRYRGEENAISQYVVEVIKPYEIVELIKTLYDCEIDVLVLTSPAATRIIFDQSFYYHSSKSSLETMVRYYAANSQNGRIRAFGIDPGSFVLKDRNIDFYKASPVLTQIISNSIPSGRMTTTQDVAIAVRTLIFESPRQFTGSILRIDGGMAAIDSSGIIQTKFTE